MKPGIVDGEARLAQWFGPWGSVQGRAGRVTVVLALGASPAEALAQPAPPAAPAPAAQDDKDLEAKRSEARGHFEKGLALFEKEAWDAALAEFIRSRAIYPTRAATENAAF